MDMLLERPKNARAMLMTRQTSTHQVVELVDGPLDGTRYEGKASQAYSANPEELYVFNHQHAYKPSHVANGVLYLRYSEKHSNWYGNLLRKKSHGQ